MVTTVHAAPVTLRFADASFAENFYGLKRVRSVGPSPFHTRANGITPRHPRAALMTLVRGRSRAAAPLPQVALPYLRGRIDAYYQSLTEPTDEDGLENGNLYVPYGEQ